MFPVLRSPHSRAAFLAALLAAGTVSAGLVRAAGALDLAIAPPREGAGSLWVDVRVTEPFAPRVVESLSRGMPATLVIDVELWRRRTAWFDRLENSFETSIRVRYDVWSRTYRVARSGAPPVEFATLDSVGLLFSQPLAVPAARLDALKESARYYLVVSATLRPLSVEDVQEGEGWLSGEVETKRRAGLGVVTAVPRAVFDAVRNFAGLGDQRVRAISTDFEVGSLAGR